MNKHQRRIQHSTMTRRSQLKSRRQRRLVVLFFLFAIAFAGYSLISSPPTVQAVSPNIVISQIYGAGGNGGATYNQDFIELYNRSSVAVNITGWTLQYVGATGNFSTAANSFITLSGTIGPGKYFLVAASNVGGVGAALPTPDQSVNFNMAAGAGKVSLRNTSPGFNGVACPGGSPNPSDASIVDFVGYGTTANCYEGAGPTPIPTATNSVIRKSNTAGVAGTTGCQDTDNNSADFQLQTPTPRNSATPAAACGVGEFSIAFESASQGCAFNSVVGLPAGGTFTWNHTLGSGDSQALYVGVSTSLETLPVGLGTVPPRVSVTYNGVSMTAIGSRVSGEGALPDTRAAVEMFRLINAQLPPPGTYPVVVTFLQPVNYAVGGSASFNGVNQTTPNRAFVSNSGDTSVTPANTPQINVTSASNEVVLDTVGQSFNAATLLVGPGQTERWNGLSCFGGLNSIGAGSTEPGAATTTMSWTQGSTGTWAIGAVSIIPLAPTEAKLAAFEAAQTNAGVLLRWQTGYEVNNLGFNLYREQKGKRTRLNPSPLAGSALLAGQHTRLTAGQSYSWLDRSTKNREAAQYWLEDIDLDGTRTLHGPIGISAGENLQAANEEQAMLLSQLSQSPSSTNFLKGYPAFQPLPAAASSSSPSAQAVPARVSQQRRFASKLLLLNENLLEAIQTTDAATTTNASNERASIVQDNPLEKQRTLAAGAAVKIAIRQAGWYRLTQAELLAAGINPSVDPSLLQLYADGVEQAMLLNGNAQQFGADSSIEFYGTGLDTRTSDTRTYWLVVGSQPGKRVGGQNNQGNSNYRNWIDKDVVGPVIITPAGPALMPQQTVNPVTPRQPAATSPAPVNTRPNVPGVFLILPRNESPAASSSTAPKGNSSPDVSSDSPKAKKKKALTKRNKRKLLRQRHHALIRTQDSPLLYDSSSESFAYSLERKERTVYFSALLNGDDDNFFGPVITATPVNQTFNLSGIDKWSPSPAMLEVSLQGGTVQPHQVRVMLNGNEVGVMSFADQTRAVQQFQIEHATLAKGENTVTLTSLAGDGDVNVVDYVRLTYRHVYRAVNDQLTFTSQHTAPLTIDGFTSSQVKVFDITNPNDVKQLNIKTSKGSGFAVKIPGGDGTLRTLLAVTESQIQHPAGISMNEPSSLSLGSNRANFIILTHRDFRDAVKPLADLRRSQGMAVAVVNVEDVYDEFGYGAQSRQAVKDFFAWAKSNWEIKPDYALLVGDSSLDPRNYLGTNRPDYVPTIMVDTRRLETASDDALVDFNNDGIADIAVGRLPVQTVGQAQKVIAKITGYVPGQSGTGALLVSDHFEDYDFEAANENIRALLPSGMAVTTVNRRDNSAEQVRSDIVAGINQGPQLVNYAGHGSVEVWTGAGILRSIDKSSLTNGNKLPVVVTMTCLNGFFHDVFTESLAEALIRAEGGGAVAVWASSGLTEPDRQTLMDQQLISLLFATGQSPALGDAVKAAKEATADMDVRRTWILFGDPTMHIR